MQVNNLSKNNFSVMPLNEIPIETNFQTVIDFKSKLTDISILNNNEFFIKSIDGLPKNINSNYLTKDNQELESYHRDTHKIEKIYGDAVQEMTDKGERINPLLGNNFRRNIEGIFNRKASDYDPNKSFHYLQCYEQTDKIIKKLNEQKDTLENKWKFDDVSNYPDWRYTHTWGRATPANNSIPFIYFDPFWDKIKTSTCQCESRDACAPCKP